MNEFSTQLQEMVLSTPPIVSRKAEDRKEQPVNQAKREDNLMNDIGLALKRR